MSGHKNSKQQFLDNLRNYVPLGSVLAVANDGHFFYSKWQELPEGLLGIDQSTKGIQHLRFLHFHRWVRVCVKRCTGSGDQCTLRVYLLPEDNGRRWVDREGGTSHPCRKSLKYLMEEIIDFSTQSWQGDHTGSRLRSLMQCFADLDREDSLFYIFNTIQSPMPDGIIDCRFSRDATAALLEPTENLGGLRTSMYPYQRRSAAAMVRREAKPAMSLDPRFETFVGPVGNTLYYDMETTTLLRDQRTYEEARGGILAETMGLGKTLICLAVMYVFQKHQLHLSYCAQKVPMIEACSAARCLPDRGNTDPTSSIVLPPKAIGRIFHLNTHRSSSQLGVKLAV